MRTPCRVFYITFPCNHILEPAVSKFILVHLGYQRTDNSWPQPYIGQTSPLGLMRPPFVSEPSQFTCFGRQYWHVVNFLRRSVNTKLLNFIPDKTFQNRAKVWYLQILHKIGMFHEPARVEWMWVIFQVNVKI